MEEHKKPKIIAERKASPPKEEKTGHEEKKPRIRVVVEPVVPREKPSLIQELEESASRDILPTRVEPGTPLQITDKERKEAIKRAHEIWEQKERERAQKKPIARLKRLLGLKT